MKRKDAEAAIRHLCNEWSKEANIARDSSAMPSYFAFKSWAENKGYGQYFKFRSVRGADADAELWFDQEFDQTWRD